MNNIYDELLKMKYSLMSTVIKYLDILKIQVVGNSMYPTLKDKSLVNIVYVNESDLNIGDIVLYVSKDNSLVLHRLIGKEGNVFIIKGDNEDFIDKIKYDQVLGRVAINFNKEDFNRDLSLISEIENWRIILSIKKNYLNDIEVNKLCQ